MHAYTEPSAFGLKFVPLTIRAVLSFPVTEGYD